MGSALLYEIGQGISLGANSALIKRNEESVRAGRSPFLTSIFQASHIGLAKLHVTSALKAARVIQTPPNPVITALQVAIIVTPFFLALALHNVIENDTVRSICLFLQNQISNLCQLVSIVSAVAMIAFGNIAIGAASLTFLILGALDKHDLFPENVSYLFRKATIPLMIVSSLLTDGALQKVIALIHLGVMALQKYSDYQNADKIREFEDRQALFAKEQKAFIQAHSELLPQKENCTPISHSGLLTPTILERILAGDIPLKVNLLHLKVPAHLMPQKATKLETLLTFFDEIDWDETNIRDLSAKLLQDARFREFTGVNSTQDLQRKGIPNSYLIGYVREQLKELISQVKGRRVEAGAIHDYERLENYLKIIIEGLSHLSLRDRASYIAILGIEGGQYCGPGKFHAVENIWAMIAWKTKNMPLGAKVLFHLQDERTKQVNKLYGEFVAGHFLETREGRVIKYLFNYTDLHIYNQVMNIYADELGIRKEAADNDEMAIIPALTQVVCRKAAEFIRNEFFNEFYTMDFIVKETRKKSGTELLPTDEIVAWWKYWMLKQENGQELVETFSLEDTVYGKRFTQGDLKINPLFIKAMLFDMGILECSSA